MTFLNGLFLVALPLLAVPIAIHLYRGKQKDVIPWGAMQFLAEAVTKGRSMERLEELLLMLMRVAAVAALIFALARPMIRSTWLGSGGDREVVLVVDNSLSTARTVDGVSVHDQLMEKIHGVIAELSAGDSVHLLLAAGGGQWLTAEGVDATSAGKQELGELVDSIQPSLGRADLLDALQLVVNMQPKVAPAMRRVVVCTDDQARSWQLDAEGAWQQLGLARREAAVPTSIEVVDVSLPDAPADNLAVMRLESARPMVRPNEPVGMTAEVNNLGDSASVETTAEWLVGDRVFATSDLRSLGPGGSAQITATLKETETGTFAVTCRLAADDQIELDGQQSIAVEVADELPVLFVFDSHNDFSSKPVDGLFFAALGYEKDKPLPWHAIYRPDLIASSELAEANLADYRAVVIANLGDFDRDTIAKLGDFVRAGGGLWLGVGDRIDRPTFNRLWFDDGDGLSPLALESLVEVDDPESPAALVHPPSREHPATAQLANTTQLDVNEARITQYWQLAQSDDPRRKVSVLLESANGAPLVAENYLGQGRVLVQTFPLGLEWSNLPRLKSYVVMVHDWLEYLTTPAMARHNLTPGSAIVAPIPAGLESAAVSIVLPSGVTKPLTIQDGESGAVARYSLTQLPGLYQIEFRQGEQVSASIPFSVSRDPQESELTPLKLEERNRLAASAQVQFGGVALAAEEAGVTPLRSEPVWGPLLLALVALLAGELLLSNLLARQRSGVAVSAT